jgi:signal transduction histidine kinase
MYSKPLNLKLALLFSSIFILIAAVLFLLSYLLLSSSLRSEELREMRSRMLELWAAYQTGSLGTLQREIDLERQLQEERQFMIRVAGPRNNTLYLYLPEYWPDFDLKRLEQPGLFPEGGLARLRARTGPETLDVLSLRLPDQVLLQVGLSSLPRDTTLARFRGIFLLVAVPLLLLGFVGGAIFSSRLLRPVQHLIAAVRLVIDTGRMEARLPVRGTGDELDELVQLFNRMLQRIDSLIRAMRESLDNVAHDLKTPLTRLRNKAEAALGPPGAERVNGQALSGCIEETDRILTMLTRLMDISEAETGVMKLERRPEDLSALIRDMAELYQYAAEEKGLTMRADLPETLAAVVDPDRIRQIVANLLDNAVKYTPAGGAVTVRACREGSESVIEVEDTGMGITPEELPRIWDRLYRGDRSRSVPGLGLGLSLVRAVTRAHGGSVEAASQPERGSRFTVRLPGGPAAS